VTGYGSPSPSANDLGEKRREITKEWIKEGKISLKGAIEG